MSKLIDHVIAYWSLDDLTEATGTLDDLTNVNSATFVAGKIGDGVDVDLTNQSGLVLDNADAGPIQFGTANRSISAWVYPHTLPSSGAAIVVMGATASGDSGFHVIYSGNGTSGQFIARMSNGSTLYTASTAFSYPAEAWYHVAVCYNRVGSLVIHVNGVQAASVSISAASASDISSDDDLKIGGRYSAQTWLDGIIDEVAIFDITFNTNFLTNLSTNRDVIDWLYNDGDGRSYQDLVDFNGPWIREVRTAALESNTTSMTSSAGNMKLGDLVIHHIMTDGNTSSSLAISEAGFSELIAPVVVNAGSNPATLGVWSEVLDEDDKYTSLTATWTGNERASTVTLVISNPGAVEDVERIPNETTSTPDGPETTVTTPGLVIYGVGHDQNTALSAAPSGVMVVGNRHVVASAGTRMVVGRNRPSAPGTFGPGTWTLGGSFNNITFGYHVQSVESEGDLEVSGAITQGAATLSGAAEALVHVSGSLTQGAATLSGSAEALVQASGALIQGAATLSASAEVLVQLSGSLTQGAATITGTIGTPALSVSGSLTQGGQALAGTAEALVQAFGSLVQGGQSLLGTATAVVTVSGSLTQGGAVITGTLVDPNNQIADIELSASPLVGIAMLAATSFNITISASPDVS